jgi:predicted PurR-regulated permease PerM
MIRAEAWRWLGRGTGLGVGLVLVATLAFIVLQAINALLVVFVSILLAAGLEPVTGWLRDRTGRGRGPIILFVYAGFFLVVALVALLIVPATASQLGEFGAKLPTLLAHAREWAAGLRPPPLADALTSLIDAVSRATPTQSASGTPGTIVSAGLAAADVVITILSVLTLVYFWLTGHQHIQRFALAMLPADNRAGVREGWNEVEARLGLWVRGQLILMGSIFLMTTAAYFLLGLENPLLLGVIAGLAEAIPLVGPALGAVPALLVALTSDSPEKAILVALVYVGIQVLEGNVLVPIVMRSSIGVPPFLIVVSLLVGSAVAGIVGAFLALPIAAVIVVILERAQARETSVALEGISSGTQPTEEESDRLVLGGSDSKAALPP